MTSRAYTALAAHARSHYDITLIVTNSLLSMPRPPLRTYVTDILPRLIYKDVNEMPLIIWSTVNVLTFHLKHSMQTLGQSATANHEVSTRTMQRGGVALAYNLTTELCR